MSSQDAPEPRIAPAVFHREAAKLKANDDSTIYMFGGCINIAGAGCTIDGFSSDLWAADSKTLQWRKIDAAAEGRPSPRMWSTGAVLNSKTLILYGGIGPVGSRIRQHNDTYLFDISQNKWTKLDLPWDKIPPTRLLTAMRPYGQRFAILFGGTASNPRTMSDVWLFDATVGSWQLINADGTEPRAAHTAAVWNSKLVVYGGVKYDAPAKDFNTSVAFDFKTSRWSELETALDDPTHAPGARFAPGSALIGDDLFVYSGSSAHDPTVDPTELYSLNLQTRKWTLAKNVGTEQPEKRDYGAMWAADQRIVVFGGKNPDTNTLLGDFWTFELTQ